eukprot:GHVQ01025044.1.p1 GENE.GHVQ01025044.1~~GHVQ01025044.1.p1  ORF type:complete len:214 (+),score=16.14 GHVQ01025044.1:812-1453(+)
MYLEQVRRKIAKESVDWSCPVCKKSNTTLVESKCAQPTSARPVLPPSIENLKQRRSPSAGLASSTSSASSVSTASDLAGALPAQPSSTDSAGPRSATEGSSGNSYSQDVYDTENKAKTSGSSAEISQSNGSSPKGSAQSDSRADTTTSTQPSSRRSRPERANRSMLSQLFRYPETKIEAFVCAADVLVVVLVGAMFVLLLDVVFHPPDVLSRQ